MERSKRRRAMRYVLVVLAGLFLVVGVSVYLHLSRGAAPTTPLTHEEARTLAGVLLTYLPLALVATHLQSRPSAMSLAMETAEANAVLTRSREQREAAQRELESIEADLYTPALLRAAASDLAEHARIRERIQRFREFTEERTASEEELDDLLTRSTRTIRGDLNWLVFTGLVGIVGIFCCLMMLLWPRGSALFLAFVASLIVTGGLAEATTDPILRHLGTKANIAWRLMILLPMTVALGVAVWLGPAIEVVP